MKIAFRCFFVLILTLSYSVLGQAGGSSVRGGGDDVGLDFQAAYFAALEEIKLTQPDLQILIASANVEMIARNAQVLVVEGDLVIPGDTPLEVVAINDPDSRIITVSRSRWTAIEHETLKKSLALHELLSLAGLESTGRYPISGVYLSRIRTR